MNPKNRLENAQKILSEIVGKKDIKKAINNDIRSAEKNIEELLTGEKEPTMKAIKTNYNRVVKLEGKRKSVNSEINKLDAALRDCISGKGDYDKDQLDFDDIYSQEEKTEESSN